MSSSASDPQTPSGTPQGSPAKPQQQQAVPDRALLENVMQQTLVEQSAEALDPAEREALLAVAERHRAEPFELEPVVVELVQAVLQIEFKHRVDSSDVGRKLCYEVARTLYEDPLTRERLLAFWARLCDIRR